MTIARLVAGGAAAIWLAATSAAAQDLTDLARRAEAAIAAGRTIDALDVADEIRMRVWNAAPLAFRKTVLVAAAPQGFGDYEPRDGNVFAPGEVIRLYVEPVAFGWKKTADGFESDLVSDLQLATPDGETVASRADFGTFKIVAERPGTQAFLVIDYVFGGLRPGDYIITTTLEDRVAGKSASFSTPITIR